MLRTQKRRQIRRLGDPNPMDDVPDQDSAKILGKKFKLDSAYPSKTGYIFRFLPTRVLTPTRPELNHLLAIADLGLYRAPEILQVWMRLPLNHAVSLAWTMILSPMRGSEK